MGIFTSKISQCSNRFTTENAEHVLWLRFVLDRRWSRKKKRALLDHYGEPQAVYAASDGERAEIVGSDKKAVKDVDSGFFELQLQQLAKDNTYIISCFDERFPKLLTEIDDPPLALFVRGDVSLLAAPKVAIVGSRRPSPVGKKIATDLARGLSQSGITVTSGLAYGIDGVAHDASVGEVGRTVAVLGGGLDCVYPQRNRALYERISNHGCLISEYPFSVKPTRYSFPERNRIVSGLSLGTIVIEAAEKSGTLITARLTVEQNRELMVVPGTAVSDQYAGSHRLIQDGAALVCEADDVLRCLQVELGDSLIEHSRLAELESVSTQNFSDEEKTVLGLIQYDSTSIDALLETSGLTAGELSSMLIEFELNGLVEQHADGGYVKLS